jgi:hypothetical protein
MEHHRRLRNRTRAVGAVPVLCRALAFIAIGLAGCLLTACTGTASQPATAIPRPTDTRPSAEAENPLAEVFGAHQTFSIGDFYKRHAPDRPEIVRESTLRLSSRHTGSTVVDLGRDVAGKTITVIVTCGSDSPYRWQLVGGRGLPFAGGASCGGPAVGLATYSLKESEAASRIRVDVTPHTTFRITVYEKD